MERIRILIVEDSPNDAELLVNELRVAGFTPDAQCVETETAYRVALTSHPEIVFADFSMPKFSFHRALSLIHDSQLDIPLIAYSGTLDEESLTECLKIGATDYIYKQQLGRAGPVTRRALGELRQRNELRQLDIEFSRIQKIAVSTGSPAIGITSEFANLLTVIQGHADVLLFDVTLNEGVRKSLEQISCAAGRAAKLATRLLPEKIKVPGVKRS